MVARLEQKLEMREGLPYTLQAMRRFPSRKPGVSLPKLILAAGAGLYFLWWSRDPSQGQFLDMVNILVHEAGHTVFRPFGEYLCAAGGSMLQVIMPAAFVVHFFRRKDPYEAGMVLLWVGQSALNVSVYSADAVKMELPLLGGDAVTHDWNYLLEEAGLLKETWLVAGLIRLSGTLAILAGMVIALTYAVKKPSDGVNLPGGIV
ncbi:MAG: hypothetical protein ABI036_13105 [Fibrobacteria bacterium]